MNFVHFYPCFLVSESLGAKLQTAGLTGFEVGDVEVEKDRQFHLFYGDRELPAFRWLKITGEPGSDDFFLIDQFWLVVSSEALSMIETAEVPTLSADEYFVG